MVERIDHALPADVGQGPGFGYAFARRLVVDALRNGVSWFRAHSAAWSRVLAYLDASELAAVQTYFATRAPVIRAGFARADADFPQIVVNVAAERPTDQFIGEVLDTGVAFEELAATGELHGELQEQTLHIQIWADHPDVALYLYEWAKYTLRAHHDWFGRQGLIDPDFRGGAEIQPDPRYFPETLYLRQIAWATRGTSAVPEPMPDPPRRVVLDFAHVTAHGRHGGLAVGGSADGA